MPRVASRQDSMQNLADGLFFIVRLSEEAHLLRASEPHWGFFLGGGWPNVRETLRHNSEAPRPRARSCVACMQ